MHFKVNLAFIPIWSNVSVSCQFWGFSFCFVPLCSWKAIPSRTLCPFAPIWAGCSLSLLSPSDFLTILALLCTIIPGKKGNLAVFTTAPISRVSYFSFLLLPLWSGGVPYPRSFLRKMSLTGKIFDLTFLKIYLIHLSICLIIWCWILGYRFSPLCSEGIALVLANVCVVMEKSCFDS